MFSCICFLNTSFSYGVAIQFAPVVYHFIPAFFIPPELFLFSPPDLKLFIQPSEFFNGKLSCNALKMSMILSLLPRTFSLVLVVSFRSPKDIVSRSGSLQPDLFISCSILIWPCMFRIFPCPNCLRSWWCRYNIGWVAIMLKCCLALPGFQELSSAVQLLLPSLVCSRPHSSKV